MDPLSNSSSAPFDRTISPSSDLRIVPNLAAEILSSFPLELNNLKTKRNLFAIEPSIKKETSHIKINKTFKIKKSNSPKIQYHEKNPFYTIQTRCPSMNSIDHPYLHANKINIGNIYAIAMQYPKNLNHFWALCQKNQSVIFDLTNSCDLSECFLTNYHPDSKRALDSLSVECTAEKEISELITEYEYEINHQDFKTKISRIHYQDWKDQSILENEKMKNLVEIVLKFPTHVNQRAIFHCIAGSGRTMTLIIACCLYNHLKHHSKISDQTLSDFLEATINSAREQRGEHAINRRQSQFLFSFSKYLQEIFTQPHAEQGLDSL